MPCISKPHGLEVHSPSVMGYFSAEKPNLAWYNAASVAQKFPACFSGRKESFFPLMVMWW